MLFSYKLLARLVDLTLTDPKTLRLRLTGSGFEVEGMEPLAQADHLVIGHILTCVKHPDSDHLHCLEVELGSRYGIQKIVCGAPNARAGLNVIVALPGAVLPAIGETIAKSVIRGQESNGMCCSLTELGVSKELLSEAQAAGIEELPADAPIGEGNVLGYLGLDDSVLDVNVLPNRPDCLSYLGLAREISSLTGYPLMPVPSFKDVNVTHNLAPQSLTNHCPRLDILRLSDVVSKPVTPLWIQRALQASGLRPVSPLVDLGNFSMLLTGQPLNLYDSKKNPSGQYVVRDDLTTTMETFDGKPHSLIPGDLVVTDGQKPLCLAGIMAGKAAAVDASTTDVDIEAAIFYHVSIRHTSARLGLSSPSSQLFAKERNGRMIDEAWAVTLAYLPEFVSSFKLAGYGSFVGKLEENKPLAFSLDALNHRLGGTYTSADVATVLERYRITKLPDGTLLAPTDRVDLLEQCDIEEEVFRFYGAEKLVPSLEHFPLTQGGETDAQKSRRALRSLLIDRGFDEVLSYTLIDEAADQAIRVFDKTPSYKLVNPMTKDHEIVRSDLLPSLLAVIDSNVAHGNEDLKLFEISNVDNPHGSHLYLSLALRGNQTLTQGYQPRPFVFEDIKGVVESLLSRLGLAPTRYRLSYSKNPAFHPYASADLTIGHQLVGTFGAIHPTLRKDNLYLGELDLGYLLALPGLRTRFEAFSSDTKVRRDVSFESRGDVSYSKLVQTITSVKDTYLEKVEFFDDFTDPVTQQSFIGVSLYFAKPDATLKGEEIDASVLKIVTAVKTQLGLSRRGEAK